MDSADRLRIIMQDPLTHFRLFCIQSTQPWTDDDKHKHSTDTHATP